jgi:hypothetical protein
MQGLSSALAVDFAGSYAVGAGTRAREKPPFEGQAEHHFADGGEAGVLQEGGHRNFAVAQGMSIR